MDPHAQTDRHIADAKAQLTARIEELGRRFHQVKQKLDLPAHIEAHPLIAVGGAFVLGALLGMRRKDRRRPDGTVERGMGGAILAVLGAIGLRLSKEVAARYVSDAAKSWLAQRDSDRAASHDPSVESFLGH
jgi:hypothetical protein